MKNLIVFLLVFSAATCGAQTFKLTVKLEGLKEERGGVRICLMNKSEQFLEDCYIGKVFRFGANEPRRVVFAGIPPGEYAIMAFHDVDGNARLNCDGAFGLPSEPYAFSNNPNTWFGPPKYRKCAFTVTNDQTLSLEF